MRFWIKKSRVDGAAMDFCMMFGDIVSEVCCPWFPEMAELIVHRTVS